VRETESRRVLDELNARVREHNRKFEQSDIVRDLGAFNETPSRVNAAIETRATAADTVGGIAAIAGSAALLVPELLPVAAIGGIGYGVYKLGETLKLW
jgi:hypothetical protein